MLIHICYEQFLCRKVFMKILSIHTDTHTHIVLFFADSNKTLNQASAKHKPIQVNKPRT